MTMARTKTYHFACSVSLRKMTNCVGPGSGMPALANIVWNVGITKMSRTATAPTATVRMTPG
jgi:hypothetical protein